MTLTLASLRSSIRLILGDPSAARYSNDSIDDAIRRALTDISRIIPNLTSGSLTLSSTGRDINLSPLPIHAIVSIRFPHDESADPESTYHDAFYFYTSSGSPFLYIQGSRIPQSGDKISFEYITTHTIQNLDSAAQTTLPEHLAYLLTTGAAAYAAIFRSSQISEYQGSRASDMNQLYQWGNQLMTNFRGMLADLKTTPIAQNRLPGLWRLDPWDTN